MTLQNDHYDKLAQQFDSITAQIFRENSQIATIPANTRLFQSGMECCYFSILLEGVVRVQTMSASGRDIVLYRVTPDETCIMTLSCLLGHTLYAAEGISETPIRVISLPIQAFERALSASEAFRNFVFSSYSNRMLDLVSRIEEIAFTRIDTRLASYLLRQTKADSFLTQTHQSIASELGTAREVVSRQLKEFERSGWVELLRGQINVLDRTGLSSLISDLAS